MIGGEKVKEEELPIFDIQGLLATLRKFKRL